MYRRLRKVSCEVIWEVIVSGQLARSSRVQPNRWIRGPYVGVSGGGGDGGNRLVPDNMQTPNKCLRLTSLARLAILPRMRFFASLLSITSVLTLTTNSQAAFYGDPPDANHPWAIHDMNRPQPKTVTSGTFSTQEKAGKPPSDAIILFDGTDLSKWQSTKQGGGPAKWAVRDGYIECVPREGDIRTIEEFGDCQLHVEWAAPSKVEGSSQGRGNSGVFLMGIVEVQVLDNYNNPTYADGYAGSVYGVNPPAANALRPPGEFQVYDIVFRRPIYKGNQVVDPGYVTVFMNGVLVQDHTPLEGGTGHMKRTVAGPLPEKGPLKFQDHGNTTRFRNIWYRKLPTRSVEGGTDGRLTEEATMAKRKEIAAEIRADAAAKPAGSLDQVLRLTESLAYAKDDSAVQQVEKWAADYANSIKQLSADKLPPKKDEVKRVASALDYTVRFNILPSLSGPKNDLQKIIREQRWDK